MGNNFDNQLNIECLNQAINDINSLVDRLQNIKRLRHSKSLDSRLYRIGKSL